MKEIKRFKDSSITWIPYNVEVEHSLTVLEPARIKGTCYADTRSLHGSISMSDVFEDLKTTLNGPSFEIEDVIFSGPATIVLWKDGTKTVVKTRNREAFDPEKGIAMAIAKKALGNKGSYYNTINHWVKENQKRAADKIRKACEKLNKATGIFSKEVVKLQAGVEKFKKTVKKKK
jgi:hypothetical protein